MKNFFSIILTISMLLSCSPEGHSGDTSKVPGGGTQYRLTVDGKPFLMLGAQLRTDFFLKLDGRRLDQLDDYFSLAKGLNVTCVQVPVCWSDIETEYDVYSDEVVKAYIDYCEKYDMKLELLWFGSYMCGYSVEGYLPQYVVKDTETYPELKPSAAYKGWMGKQFYLVPNDKELVEREVKAMSKMMEFIYDYDNELGNPHTVIGIQVENEPDMLATRHNAAHGYSAVSLWPALLAHLNSVGLAVKNGPYDCYTRVNQTCTYEDWIYWSGKVASRDGIDYVGFDPYVNNVQTIGDWLQAFKDIPGNFSHVAENGGEYFNNDILTLKAFVMGCGYEVFEVITTPHKDLKDWTLRGVYNPDFTPKPQTQRLIDAYSIFKAAWYDFATAPVGDMLGFNLVDQYNGLNRTEEAQSTESSPSHIVRWSTTSRGVAFAIQAKDYMTVGSTQQDYMYLDFEPTKIEAGKYDNDGNWIVTSDASSRYSNGTLTMQPCTVYRLYFN